MVRGPWQQLPPDPAAVAQAGAPPEQANPSMPWTSDWEQTRVNPYTGQPLAENEYVGWAGSEADHPGMVRIPPPGWWDPSNPNYERRNYYVDPQGNTVAREAGYYNPDQPWDTGREGERQGEYRGMSLDDRRYSEPGVPTWGPGKEKPAAPGYSGPPSPAGKGPAQHPFPNRFLDSLLGGPVGAVDVGNRERFNQAGDPTQSLMYALADLYKRLPGRRMRGRLPAE